MAQTKVRRTPTRTPKKPQAALSKTDERRKMIEIAAYYRAEKRGFRGGDPVADWLEAETEISRLM